MEELITSIKFVGAGNGGGGTSGSIDAAASGSASTGDITMLIMGIVALIVGVIAIWATMAYRKRAVEGAHVSASGKTFMPMIPAVIAITLGLGLTIASTSSIKAHAEGAISTNTCIGTVDEQTGAISFNEITMTNNSDTTQVLNTFELVAADGVTTLNDAVWTFKADGETFFEGKFGADPEEDWFPLSMPAKYSSTLTVSVTGISTDVAKSLINKEVAYAKSSYDALYTVSASVDGGSTYGSVSPTTLDVINGTTYEVSGDTITFGKGVAEQTITFTPTSGYKLKNWTVDGSVVASGTVTSALAFVANTESAVTDYTGTIMLSGIDGASGPASGVTVQFTYPDSNTEPVTADTDANGKYTLTGVSAGTVGTVSIADPDKQKTVNTEYEQQTITTTKGSSANLKTLTTRKLTTLQVKIYKCDLEGNTGLHSTRWCPAIDTTAGSGLSNSKIKFYNKNRVEISVDSEYHMSDLYNSTDDNNSAFSFAFLTSGNTLSCFQITHASWNEAFGTQESGTATGFVSGFEQITTDTGTINRVQDFYNGSAIAPQSMYWDTTDGQSWTNGLSYGSETPFPTLNGIHYDDWYAAYNGWGSSVLEGGTVPATCVLSSSPFAFHWGFEGCGWDLHERTESDDGIVLKNNFVS